jgi:signal transduction histidine kinase
LFVRLRPRQPGHAGAGRIAREALANIGRHAGARHVEIALGGNARRVEPRALELNVRTVETHRLNIKRKLGIEGPAELIKFAVERGAGR